MAEQQPVSGPGDAGRTESAAVVADFVLGSRVTVPSGGKARARANIAAIELVQQLARESRPATGSEQTTIAAWSGWGAVPQVFDPRNATFEPERARLKELLTANEYREAEASILNAHYTDPAISQQVWQLLERAGFSGGRVLEPGCGSGNFLGHAPSEAVMVGVELDPMTSKMAAALYPSAQVRNEGFEQTRVPEGSFAATVGNVPFGRFAVPDPVHNPDRHSIHNHFILKSIALTAPGGYVAVITSRFTMDAQRSRAREEMARHADLIGAVRLPTAAFARVAGTDVTTDLLVLRNRESERDGPMPDWVRTVDVAVSPGGELLGRRGRTDDDIDLDAQAPESVAVNTYFVENPNRILGTVRIGHGQYGAQTMVVDALDDLSVSDEIRAELGPVIDRSRELGYGLTATADSLVTVEHERFDPGLITAADRGPATPLDTLRYNADEHRIDRWTGTAWVDNNTASSKIAETRKLLELRDVATSLVLAQRDGRPTADKEALRGELNRRYDDYVRVHGPINRFTMTRPKETTAAKHDERYAKLEAAWREAEGDEIGPYAGRVPDELAARWDEKAWKSTDPVKRRPHLEGGIRNDPGWAVIAALEHFDENSQKASKAPLFSKDVLSPPVPREHADSPQQALALSMEVSRTVDVERIAALLRTDVADAREQLSGLVYPSLSNPDTLVPATDYLSGNVRAKYYAAVAAAGQNPIYRENVAALEALIPPELEPHEIRVRPGVTWVTPNDMTRFVTQTFGIEPDHVTIEKLPDRWTVDVPSWHRKNPRLTEDWGTPSLDGVELFEKLCNSKAIEVNRSAEDIARDGGPALDGQATFAAQAKAEKITAEFKQWIWSDPERADRLAREYNTRFNSRRAPRHDGSYLTFPGLADHFVPHPYQRDAVARIIAEPTVLLDHVVGAGKTGTMFMGAMELKRLGLVKQPWIVVPNHILEQVGREAKQWYPAANILMGTAATTAEGRRRLVAQSATSDWDMVIVPQSAFTLIGVDDELKRGYIEANLAELREVASTVTSDKSKKQIELAIKVATEKLDKLLAQDRKDTGLTFEQSGCDYLFVDEAHMYKNKTRASNVTELACPRGSQQAEDLAMKLDLLRQRRRDEAIAAGVHADQVVERVATFATGTPIANSLGELWVMQNYLRPDLLREAGVARIDDWGAVFTATVTDTEMNSTGTKLRPVTRVGKFVNLPELLQLSSVYSDVVTRDQVPVRLPTLTSGERQISTLVPDQETRDFMTDLAYRVDHLDPRDPARDNNLKIASDGRNASLDPRLAHLPAPENGGRAADVAEKITSIHEYSKDTVYLDETGQPSPTRGALQIVFCDRGTPKPGHSEFSVYDALRDELIARGMPADKIRYIHEARTPSQKLALSAACRSGEVHVLIGSTEKMGTGTNVQDRAIAIHHMDVPWRPADLEQREGRGIRQGNQNDTIEIWQYVTENTADTVMWQTVRRKATFIHQTKRGEVDVREIEDLSGGDIGNAAAATKAMATGDPRYLRQVELDDDVKRLTALQKAHTESIARNSWLQTKAEARIGELERQISTLERPAAEIRARRDGDERTAPVIVVAGTSYTEPKKAAAAFTESVRSAYVLGRNDGLAKARQIATIGGIEVLAARSASDATMHVALSVPSKTRVIEESELFASVGNNREHRDPAAVARGLLQRVENIYHSLPEHLDILRGDLASTRRDLDELRAVGHGSFDRADELTEKKTELRALTVELSQEANSAAAQAERAAAKERMDAKGRDPGWSLQLNPTPKVLAELGLDSADQLRAIMADREFAAARARADTEPVTEQPDIGPVELAEAEPAVDDIEPAGEAAGAAPPPAAAEEIAAPAAEHTEPTGLAGGDETPAPGGDHGRAGETERQALRDAIAQRENDFPTPPGHRPGGAGHRPPDERPPQQRGRDTGPERGPAR